MAARKHSRFTDEVHATPAPTPSKIQVRTTEQLQPEIFLRGNHQDLAPGLLIAEEINAAELYEKYPPNFKDKNKQLIFSLLNTPYPYKPLNNRSILLTRWRPFIAYIEGKNEHIQVLFQSDSFSYQLQSDRHCTEWYLNFADSNLFAYYAGPLLAQDELQVLECVQLASLREYFVQAEGKNIFTPIGADTHTGARMSTPVLISNVERAIQLDVRDIYGNNFAKASPEKLKAAFKKVEPPQPVNLIAIEAPSYGRGHYTVEQITYILNTCYSGFKAAQILTLKTFGLSNGTHVTTMRGAASIAGHNLRTVIHTGWWGCGAYGNNRQLILIAQILAAHWALVDKIVFHVQSDQYANDIKAAKDAVNRLLPLQDVRKIIDELFKMNFEWEKSNNT